MELRRLTTVEDMKKCVALQIAAWDLDPVEAMPHHFFISVVKFGGLVIGGFEGEELVSFMYTLPSLLFEGRRVVQEWDMLAVLPDLQGHGIAFDTFRYYTEELPEHCREFQYAPVLSYTFDPLVGRNAHLFIRKLGTLATTFYANLYGEMTGINAGLRTDRVRTILRPLGSHSQARMNGQPSPLDVAYEPEYRWISTLAYKDGLPRLETLRLDHTDDVLFLQIPDSFPELKTREIRLAQEWQQSLADAFAHYLGAGWVMTDFLQEGTPEQPFGVYVLRRDLAPEYTTVVSPASDYL